MNNILVLGFGVASSSYISLLDHNEKKVSVIGTPYDLKKIRLLQRPYKKKKYHSELFFSKNISFFEQLNINDIPKYSLIIIGVNSNGISWAAEQLRKLKKICTILILTKGLYKEKNKVITISDYFLLNTNFKNIVSAAGPCLAKELIKKTHTRTVLASSKIENAKFVKKILENDYYHPDITTDIKGAEICAATKNIYATIIGAAVGQSNSYLSAIEKNKYHFNAASALFEQSLREMLIIIKKYNGLASTVMGLAGAGDLYVSALGGRNSKMGSFLGQGYLYKKIITSQMKGITIEGAELMLDVGSELLRIVGQKKLPLAALLLKVFTKNKKLVIDWKKFIN
ncbi:MAG: glycerol-3-phosphate dehydrogenase [Proteobacteria bacterium]|nr:glycerol-3-phosphate dehydrogenase [Pseudomonadota bacterium]MDA0995444.1 glycerol-3-phosphate dehydrogenase [Pseudomonadota bacterium]